MAILDYDNIKPLGYRLVDAHWVERILKKLSEEQLKKLWEDVNKNG